MTTAPSVWISCRFDPPPQALERVRALIEMQEAARRVHPGPWLPAPNDHALRIRPARRVREPMLDVIDPLPPRSSP